MRAGNARLLSERASARAPASIGSRRRLHRIGVFLKRCRRNRLATTPTCCNRMPGPRNVVVSAWNSITISPNSVTLQNLRNRTNNLLSGIHHFVTKFIAIFLHSSIPSSKAHATRAHYLQYSEMHELTREFSRIWVSETVN